MKIKILAFGKIAEITNKFFWEMQDFTDTLSLKAELEKQYPTLEGMSYQIAVDKKIIKEHINLTLATEVALLPPFSGG